MHEGLIPVLTGISLLLAGVLVGYFLWFRDRRVQEGLCQQLTAENECLNSQLRDAALQTSGLQDQLQRRESKAENLQILCNDLLASREKTVQHASLLDSELYSARLQLEQAKSRFVTESETLTASLDSERDRNQSLVRERDQAITNSEVRQTEINGLKKRSENQESTIRKLRSRLDETCGELTGKTESQRQMQNGIDVELQQERANSLAKIHLLEAGNVELRIECTTLMQKKAELEKSVLSNESTLKRVSEENDRLRQASRQYEDLVGTLTEELGRTKNHARVNEDTIRNLRRERGAVLMRNRQSMPQFPRIHAAPKEEYSDADLLSKEYGGPTRIDPIRGVVFIEAPRMRDDLKKIYGVAKVLEQRLNESGIYAFRQIMKWDEKAIREFSELLVFKDRIYRDDWLGQAARLYLQKQRTDVA